MHRGIGFFVSLLFIAICVCNDYWHYWDYDDEYSCFHVGCCDDGVCIEKESCYPQFCVNDCVEITCNNGNGGYFVLNNLELNKGQGSGYITPYSDDQCENYLYFSIANLSDDYCTPLTWDQDNNIEVYFDQIRSTPMPTPSATPSPETNVPEHISVLILFWIILVLLCIICCICIFGTYLYRFQSSKHREYKELD